MVACCQRGETVLTLGRKVTLKVNEASESVDTATAGLYCSSVMRRVCSTMVWCPHFTACTLQVRGGVPEEYNNAVLRRTSEVLHGGSPVCNLCHEAHLRLQIHCQCQQQVRILTPDWWNGIILLSDWWILVCYQYSLLVRFITFDVVTSDLARQVYPGVEGLMLGGGK